MSAKKKNGMPEALRKCLAASARRVRAILAVRGLCGVLTTFLLSYGAVMAVDLMTVLFSDALRWGLWSAAAAATGWSAWAGLWKPLQTDLSPERMARLIEMRHPELEERLSSVAGLSREGNGGRYSAELMDALTKTVLADVKGIVPRKIFNGKKALPKILLAMLLALLFGILCALFPRAMAILFMRAVAPAAETGNLYSADMEVAPEDVALIKGSNLEVTVEHDAATRAKTFIRTKREGGREIPERMTVEADDGTRRRCSWKVQDVREDFTYRINCGHALTRRYQVTAVERPAATNARIVVEHPAYTGLGTVTNAAGAETTAVAGSAVRIGFEPNREGLTAALETDGKAAELAGLAGGWGWESGDAAPKQPGEVRWQIKLEDKWGFTNFLHAGTVKVTADALPQAKITDPEKKQTFAGRYGKVDMRFEATDDFGVEKAELWVALGDKEFERKGELELTGADGKKRTTGGFALDAKDFPQEGNAIKVRAKVWVADNRPEEYGGAQTNFSEVAEVIFGNLNETTEKRDMRTAEQQTMQHLNEMKQRLQELRNIAQQREEQAKQHYDPKDPNRVRQLEEALKEMRRRAQAAERAAENFAKKEDTGEVMKSQQEKVAEFAKKELEELANKTEDALMADRDKLGEKPKEIKEAAETALERLEKMREEVKEELEAREDAQAMEELAQRAEAVAKQAQKDEMKNQNLVHREEDLLRRMNQRVPQMHNEELRQKREELEKEVREAQKPAREAAIAKAEEMHERNEERKAEKKEKAEALKLEAREKAEEMAKAFREAAELAKERVEEVLKAQEEGGSEPQEEEREEMRRARRVRKERQRKMPAAAFGDWDWFKIKTKLESGDADALKDVPEEFRELVRAYFEEINKRRKKK